MHIQPPFVTERGNFLFRFTQSANVECVAPNGNTLWSTKAGMAAEDPSPFLSDGKVVVLGLGNVIMPVFDVKTEGAEMYRKNNEVYWTETRDADTGRVLWRRRTMNVGYVIGFAGDHGVSIRESNPEASYVGHKSAWLLSEFDLHAGKTLAEWRIPRDSGLEYRLKDIRWSGTNVKYRDRGIYYRFDRGRITFDFHVPRHPVILFRSRFLNRSWKLKQVH